MRKMFYILLVADALPLLAPQPGAVTAACGLVQAFLVPGIVFLLYLGDRGRPPLDDLFFAPLLSPLVLTFLVLAPYSLTASVHSATRLALGILYVLLLISPFTTRRRETTAIAVVPRGIIWISTALVALFVVADIVNDYQFAYDMVRHSAIANGVLCCFSIFIFLFLIARITRHFTDRRVHLFAVPLFAITGLTAAGWITWPLNIARALVGEIRGLEEITRFVSQMELDSRSVLQLLTAFGGYPINILEKYIIIDVQHYALNLVLLCTIVALSEEFHRTSHWRAALMAFITLIGTFLFHVFTGAFFIIVAIISGPVVLVRERMLRRTKPFPFHPVTIPCCTIAAAAIATPFFASSRGVPADGVFVPNRLGFSLHNLITIAVPFVVLLPFSWRALRGILHGDDRHGAIIGTWIVSFFIVSVAFDIRGTLESMALFPLMLLFSIPVVEQFLDSLGASRTMRRVLLSLCIAVLFLVPAVLTTQGIMLDKPTRAHEIRRYRITADERALYQWIRESTDIGDVIIERNEYNAGRSTSGCISWCGEKISNTTPRWKQGSMRTRNGSQRYTKIRTVRYTD